MRFRTSSCSLAALVGTVCGQATSSKYYDIPSGITFSSITHVNGVTYRVAFPDNSTESDSILQIVSPNDFAWCGLAWGGHMTQNPLSVSWRTGQSEGQQAIVSSRFALRSGYYAVPQPYDGATYTYLKGTSSNATHWQVTTRCQGCTRWSSADGDSNLDTQTEAYFAYACSSVAPDDRTSNTSAFNIHEQFGIWTHDLTIGRNSSYADWIKTNAVTEEIGKKERFWYG